MKLNFFRSTRLMSVVFVSMNIIACSEEVQDCLEECEPEVELSLKAMKIPTDSACSTDSPGQANMDVKNPVNLGELDDRTCAYEYAEKDINGSNYGLYPCLVEQN